MPYYVKKRIIDIIISIIMLAFLALTLLPVGWMVFSSLKSSTDIAIGRVGLSHNLEGKVVVNWGNYVDMWKNVNFGLYLKNSLIICGATMFIAMVFSTLAAYALSRFRFPGSDLFSNAILATQMIPAIMYLIPIYIMFVKFTVMSGIPVKGTYWGLILIYSAFFIPFSIWILRGFFASIPHELEEAARVDGAGPVRSFLQIILPLSKSAVAVLAVFTFLSFWNSYLWPLIVTVDYNAHGTLPVGLASFAGLTGTRWDLQMAAAIISMIPTTLLVIVLQKHLVKGIAMAGLGGR